MGFWQFNPADISNRVINEIKTFGGKRFSWDGKRWKKPTLAEELQKIDDENLDSLVEMVEFIKQNKLDLEAIKNSMGVEFNDDRTQMRFKNGVLKPMADREGFDKIINIPYFKGFYTNLLY